MAEPGDLVAVQGIGGLGHLGVQFAARMGFRVAAIVRGRGKGDARKATRGALLHRQQGGDPAAALQALGGAKVILATASDSKSMSDLIGGLGPRGRMIVAVLAAVQSKFLQCNFCSVREGSKER